MVLVSWHGLWILGYDAVRSCTAHTIMWCSKTFHGSYFILVWCSDGMVWLIQSHMILIQPQLLNPLLAVWAHSLMMTLRRTVETMMKRSLQSHWMPLSDCFIVHSDLIQNLLFHKIKTGSTIKPCRKFIIISHQQNRRFLLILSVIKYVSLIKRKGESIHWIKQLFRCNQCGWVGESVIVSDFEDIYRICRACELAAFVVLGKSLVLLNKACCWNIAFQISRMCWIVF